MVFQEYHLAQSSVNLGKFINRSSLAPHLCAASRVAGWQRTSFQSLHGCDTFIYRPVQVVIRFHLFLSMKQHHMTSPTKKHLAFLPPDTSSLGMRTFLKLFVDLPGFGRCGRIGYESQSPWLGISRKRIYTTWKGSMASG